ncbi:MAG: mannose-1-phosphate guanylyltransferase/mannose-6-phosphate isomerase [Magnetococcales bacterium]|nr:mannose-1-phosphate guanylyltransferase/mannose-6-phosphate isomerase [Magnetococcales bacterium]
MSITAVVLCGGSGTRLWPMSRKSFPKQFVALVGERSLLNLTLERVGRWASQVLCVASDEHRFLVADTLDALSMTGSLILEPEARNTAAAIALAVLHVQAQGDREAMMLFCPADHHIPDIQAFESMVEQGQAPANQGAIVTFGVNPCFPSTAYGYIRQGRERSDGSRQVDGFIEKPDVGKAQALCLQGDVLWNAGIFLARADRLVQALEHHAPDILACCRTAMGGASRELHQGGAGGHTFVRPEPQAFLACRKESIDYAVMEKCSDVAVVPFRGQWSDVGSWNAVAELQSPDEQGNRVVGHGLALQSVNTYIHAPHRPVVALGVQDLLVIDTPDAALVVHRDHVERVKDVVARLDHLDNAQAVTHRKVNRPWGWFDSIDAGPRFQVKRILVKPGSSLSLQRHHHRAEHWVVVSGTAEVTVGNSKILLTENQSTYIPLGEVHRLANPGKVPLEIIEVQSGSYLGEDDIVRFEDTYGRAGA